MLMGMSMAAVLVDMLRFDDCRSLLPFTGKLIETVLGKQSVASMSGNLDTERRGVFTQDQLVNVLARNDQSAGPRGYRDSLENVGGLLFSSQQGIMDRTGMFMGMPVFMIMIAIMVMIVVGVVMAMFVLVFITRSVLLVVIVVSVLAMIGMRMSVVGFQLQENHAHDRIRPRFKNQLIFARIQVKNTAPFEGELGFQEVTVEG